MIYCVSCKEEFENSSELTSHNVDGLVIPFIICNPCEEFRLRENISIDEVYELSRGNIPARNKLCTQVRAIPSANYLVYGFFGYSPSGGLDDLLFGFDGIEDFVVGWENTDAITHYDDYHIMDLDKRVCYKFVSAENVLLWVEGNFKTNSPSKSDEIV